MNMECFWQHLLPQHMTSLLPWISALTCQHTAGDPWLAFKAHMGAAHTNSSLRETHRLITENRDF